MQSRGSCDIGFPGLEKWIIIGMKEDGVQPRTMVLLIALTIGWGTTWPFMKIVLGELSPLWFRGGLAPVSALIMIAIARFSPGGFSAPRGQWGSMVLTSLCVIAGWAVFSAYGVSLLKAGHATILGFTMPLWTFLFGLVLLRDKVSAQRLAGLVAGIAGIAVLVSEDFSSFRTSPLGIMSMLFAASLWGLGTVVQKKADWNISTWSIAAWMMIIGGLPITVAALTIEGIPSLALSPRAALALLYILVVPTILCRYAWVKIVSQVPVTVSSVSILMTPVVSVIVSNLLLDEPIGWREVSALALVCGAMALVLTPPGSALGWLRGAKSR